MVTQVKPSAKRARDLYEAAVDHFGTSQPGECLCLQGRSSWSVQWEL